MKKSLLPIFIILTTLGLLKAQMVTQNWAALEAGSNPSDKWRAKISPDPLLARLVTLFFF